MTSSLYRLATLEIQLSCPELVSIGVFILCLCDAGVVVGDPVDTSPDSTATESLSTIIGSLDPYTRLQRTSGKLLEGELQGHDEQRLTVWVGLLETSTVAMDDVSTLWLRGGDRQRQGAIIGGITGAIVGGLLLVNLALFWSNAGYDNGPYVGCFFLGVACGVPIGAIAGGVIGAQAIEWEKRYP